MLEYRILKKKYMCTYMYDIGCDNKMTFTACSYVRIDGYIVATTVERRFTKLLSLLTRI